MTSLLTRSPTIWQNLASPLKCVFSHDHNTSHTGFPISVTPPLPLLQFLTRQWKSPSFVLLEPSLTPLFHNPHLTHQQIPSTCPVKYIRKWIISHCLSLYLPVSYLLSKLPSFPHTCSFCSQHRSRGILVKLIKIDCPTPSNGLLPHSFSYLFLHNQLPKNRVT